MAATLTQGNGVSRAVERDPCWLTFEVDSGTAVIAGATTGRLILRALPADTNIISVNISCIQADVAATSTLCSLAIGGTALFTGSADNGGVLNGIDDGLSSGTMVPSSAGGESAGNLTADVTLVGGSASTAAVWRIAVLVNRNDF